jgi:hypothetical protein
VALVKKKFVEVEMLWRAKVEDTVVAVSAVPVALVKKKFVEVEILCKAKVEDTVVAFRVVPVALMKAMLVELTFVAVRAFIVEVVKVPWPRESILTVEPKMREPVRVAVPTERFPVPVAEPKLKLVILAFVEEDVPRTVKS